MTDVAMEALGADLVNLIEFESATSKVIREAGGMMLEFAKRTDLTDAEWESIEAFQVATSAVKTKRDALDITNRSAAAFDAYWRRVAPEKYAEHLAGK